MTQKVPTTATVVIGVKVDPMAGWATEHGKTNDPILKRWCEQLQYEAMISKILGVSLRVANSARIPLDTGRYLLHLRC